MVKAVVLEAQFGGMYSRETAQGELESRVGTMIGLEKCLIIPALPSHP